MLTPAPGIELESGGLVPEAVLYGESPSRIVISFSPEKLERVKERAAAADCPFAVIGKAEGDLLTIAIDGTNVVSERVADLEDAWKNSLEKRLSN